MKRYIGGHKVRYIVVGYKTEADAHRQGEMGQVISHHYSIMDAVKSSLKYVADGTWYMAFVCKVIK